MDGGEWLAQRLRLPECVDIALFLDFPATVTSISNAGKRWRCGGPSHTKDEDLYGGSLLRVP